SSPEAGLDVPVFHNGDDPIDAINHMMSFLTSVVASRFLATNNQLRTSSNPRQQATINNGREIRVNSVNHQERQVQSTSEQSSTLTHTNTEIESDSNIIPYSQYLNENQSDTVQISTSPALQDDLILSVIEQLKTQVVTCTKINHDNKHVNDLLTAELERYKRQEREESRNIDRELALDKEVKELNNIVFKRDQSAQTVHMLTKPQVFYNHATRQALGFQNPRYLKKAQQLIPSLYDGSIIGKSDKIVVPDFENTIMHAEEKSYAEQAFWSQYSVQPDEPTHSGTTIVEVPKELPKVSMVNSCLKKLKFHLARFDIVVKERTTATAITEGTWGFEHTKACFRDDIIPFVKNLKDLFTSFDQYLIDEVSEVQKTFKQMEMAVEQNCKAKSEFQSKMETVLKENDLLLKHALGVDIVNIVVNNCMNVNCLTVDACEQCVTTESELETDFIKKENYEMLLKQYNTLEKHCISLELNNQLNTELFQRDNVSPSKSAPNFADLFEINKLKAQIQEKDTVILKLKEKIKSLRADDKEKQCDDLINQVNLKSVEVIDLNASLQERVLVITTLKEQLKGKATLFKAISLNPIDPAILQVDAIPLVRKLRKNRTTHIDYLKHTLEEAATLRELVESERLLSLLNTPLVYACKYTRRIQELLMILQQTCPRITKVGTKPVAITPKNQNQQIRRTPQITKSAKPSVDTSTSLNIESNTPVLSSTGVALASSASESKSKDNPKNNRIWRSLKKATETKLEDHPRKVKSSLRMASVVDSRASSSVINYVSNVNANLKCASCNGCLFADNHDKCVVEYINSVNACRKSKSANAPVNRKVWKTTGKVAS
nr:hypothetical protein [Tanacetum cinerariifolium]